MSPCWPAGSSAGARVTSVGLCSASFEPACNPLCRQSSCRQHTRSHTTVLTDTTLLLPLPLLLLPLLLAAHAYSPTAIGAVMQPMPTVQVELDKQGTLVVSSTAPLGRQQWQAMAKASGWSEGEQQGLVLTALGSPDTVCGVLQQAWHPKWAAGSCLHFADHANPCHREHSAALVVNV